MKYYYDEQFLEVARPILEHEEYQIMKTIKHHDASVYSHSLFVAYNAYVIALNHDLDWQSTIRGALLHDYFLYKFIKRKNIMIIVDSIKHAVSHPGLAYSNAYLHFNLNKTEENIIKSHMFPLGRLPRCREAWIVSYCDKYVACAEYYNNIKKMGQQKLHHLKSRT